jgi:type VI protein secretion system component Hcp
MPLFMRIDGVEGPYAVEGLGEDLFAIDSYNQSLFLPVSEGGAHARTISTPNISEMMITKKVDASTALLMQALCRAEIYDKVEIFDCVTESESDQPSPVSTITMENATIGQLSYNGANETEPTQALGIRFDKITWAISSVDRLTGKVEPPKEYMWEAKQAGVRS